VDHRPQQGDATISLDRPAWGDVQDRADAPVLFVVDDDIPTLELLREVAHASGWRSVGFTRLGPLRAALDDRRPTLVIVDDDLPDGRGGDLARELRSDPLLDDIPLVVCTAATSVRQAEIGTWAPVVAKPFELNEIEAFLAAALRRDGSWQAYGATAG